MLSAFPFLAFFWVLTASILVFWFRVIRRASRRVYKRSRRTSLTAGLAVSLIVLAYVVFVEHFHQQVLDVTRQLPAPRPTRSRTKSEGLGLGLGAST